MGAIAKPLAHAGADSVAIARALTLSLGVALPGEAWRNQLPLDHYGRSDAFKLLPFAMTERVDPKSRWTGTFIETYAANHVDVQMRRGATLVTSAAHVHSAEAGDGRENDLELARAAVAEFRARAGHHPARPGLPGRSMFASILVQGFNLIDAAERLIDQYASIEADGYWIVIANTRRTAKEFAAATTLAFRLEERTRKPAVLSCTGRAIPAFLAYGLSAICCGHHRGSFQFPPEDWNKRRDEARQAGDDDPGLAVHAYHPAIRGHVGLGEKANAALLELFRRWPCRCGHHQPSIPPTTGQRPGHNQWSLEQESAELCQVELGERPALLDHWTKSAVVTRREVEVGPLPPGWRAVGRRLDELRQGGLNEGTG